MRPALIREHRESCDLERFLDPGSEMAAPHDQPFGYRQGHQTRNYDGTRRPQATGNYRNHARGDQSQNKERATARQVCGPPASRVRGEGDNSRAAAQPS
ncbi:MAG: hypothetical protein E6K52_11950 [Gammaproteobacteria bacterium]|nr:MAG: hypothetical protein E6K52_11950 [Gammaproteobacteria bacterium]